MTKKILKDDPATKVILPDPYALHHYAKIGSTNDEACRLAAQGAPDSTVVWAEQQTNGRGRRGRTWVSPRGNLYVSILLRPKCDPRRYGELSFVTALAIGHTLSNFMSLDIRYKWPNDVLVGGRKIAGTLLEVNKNPQGNSVIIGVGINVASSPKTADLPATSLIEEGYNYSVSDVLITFCGAFSSWRKRWENEGFATIRTTWLSRAHGRGRTIVAHLTKKNLQGRFVDLDDTGALVLETPNGTLHRLSAADVFFQ